MNTKNHLRRRRRTGADGEKSKTERPKTSTFSFGNAKSRQPMGGDLCANHRGNSPLTPRKSLRKASSDKNKLHNQ